MPPCLCRTISRLSLRAGNLTETEQNYAQIELELLAVCFGMERFHTYVYGRYATVETDHQPLITIVKKSLNSAPKRLQRMLLRLQRYDFELTYRRGSEVIAADTLSRAAPAAPESRATDDSTHFYEELAALDQQQLDELRMVASDGTIREIRDAATDDDQYQLLISVIRSGWPDEPPAELREFSTFVDELTVYDDLIYKSDKLLVPRAARNLLLERVHTSHIGINGCIRRAREAIFWPGMAADITKLVSACSVCQQHNAANQKEPLLSHELTTRPFEKVGIDIFTFHDQDYLVTVDYFSSYFEVDRLPSKRMCDVIYCLKMHFARYGLPSTVFSDNAFNNREFVAFSKKFHFKLHHNSPRYSQSNGCAEKAVQTSKRLMTKAAESGSDVHLALLDWRNTPSEQLHQSPVQIMMGRRTRTTLPMTEHLLATPSRDQTRTALAHAKQRQARYYNRTAKPKQPLSVGQTVRFKMTTMTATGEKGKSINVYRFARTQVKLDDGRTLRRTSKHVRFSSEPPIIVDESLPDQQPAAPPPAAVRQPVAPAPPAAAARPPDQPKPTGSKTSTKTSSTRPSTTSTRHGMLADTSAAPTPATPIVTTRSGRQVVKPVRFRE